MDKEEVYDSEIAPLMNKNEYARYFDWYIGQRPRKNAP